MVAGTGTDNRSVRGWLAGLVAVLLLAACGGGGGGGDTSGGSSTAPPPVTQPGANEPKPTRDQAFRFLTQATFGPTEAEIQSVMSLGYSAWLDQQFAKPAVSHRASWDVADAAIRAADPNPGAGQREVLDSFYRQALSGEDQLRQRTVFALSQLFVISMQGSEVGDHARGVAGYLDMLGANAFGNYRTLLEQVARHPMMGIYLSHLHNQKENLATGRVPDENFAREVMQLFSIGLVQLNADGSARKDAAGKALETYAADDISGLAKVFTGWSWYGPDTSDARFWGGNSKSQDVDRDWQPMQAYAQFHSTSEKRFLGQTVVAQTGAAASLKAALDTLAGHPNVAPFIARQLIQRLVTSNPSPAYVQRAAAAFGVGGDMRALLRAVLLDDEARKPEAAADPAFGKLREPVLRLTALLRAFGARSDSGSYLIGATDDPGTQLGQTPLRAPSVFNFYRPGFVPPNSLMAAQGLAAPEMQITHETSIVGYANYLRSGVDRGFGLSGPDGKATRRDVQPDYNQALALAAQPAALVDEVSQRLLGPQANAAFKRELQTAVESVVVPALKADGSNKTQVDAALRNRVLAAVLLSAVSPEFVVQK
nr:DUF1800 domain-containing protein [uncultured Roseateles sp.]